MATLAAFEFVLAVICFAAIAIWVGFEWGRDVQRCEDNREDQAGGGLKVRCPKCGALLSFMDDNLLLSMPPKMNVLCQKCGWKGRVTIR